MRIAEEGVRKKNENFSSENFSSGNKGEDDDKKGDRKGDRVKEKGNASNAIVDFILKKKWLDKLVQIFRWVSKTQQILGGGGGGTQQAATYAQNQAENLQGITENSPENELMYDLGEPVFVSFQDYITQNNQFVRYLETHQRNSFDQHSTQHSHNLHLVLTGTGGAPPSISSGGQSSIQNSYHFPSEMVYYGAFKVLILATFFSFDSTKEIVDSPLHLPQIINILNLSSTSSPSTSISSSSSSSSPRYSLSQKSSIGTKYRLTSGTCSYNASTNSRHSLH